MKYRKLLFINLVLCLLFASCGQVSNDLNEIDEPEPVVQNSSNKFFLKGTVDSVDDDTIVVDGVVCDISNAAITLQGESETDIQLDAGMTVSIRCRSTEEEGLMIASEVDVNYEIRGIIEDIGDGTLMVMGQTVHVTEDTLLKEKTSSEVLNFSDLSIGNVVQVSGYLNAEGEIIATHIKVEFEGFMHGKTKLEIKGVIADLDPYEMTFMIGDNIIDYTNAEIKNAPAEGLSEGLRVEVESTEGVINDVLIADEVKILQECIEAENVKVEGIITEVNTEDDVITGFTINNDQPVKVDENTRYKFGDSEDLIPNKFITVKGIPKEITNDEITDNETIVILAQQIEFRITNEIQIVSYPDFGEEEDEITMLGISISVVDTTSFICKNPRKCDKRTIVGLDDLNEEDRLKVRAFQDDPTDPIIATEIQILQGNGDDVSLKGPVDALINNPAPWTFSILGVSIRIDENTEFKVRTGDPDADPRAVFFATITAGSIVEAEGMFDDAGGFILADIVELDE